MNYSYVPCPSCGKLNRAAWEANPGKEPICGHCRHSLPLHFGIAEVNATGLSALVAKSPLPVVCDFWAPWCGPCKSFAPVFQQAAHRLAPRLGFAKLNTELHGQASTLYDVRSIPTLVFFSNGKEMARISGALPLNDFVAWLEAYLPKP